LAITAAVVLKRSAALLASGVGRPYEAMNDDERAIRDVVATWMAATRAGDTATVLGLMTDDAVFMTTGRPPFGREAFANVAVAQSSAKIDGTSDIREVKVDRDLAFVRSYVSMTMTPTDGRPIQREGWTLTIFAKGTDGKWRLSRDANLMPPPKTA
jgi:uncharacterized protein (TIGR02246 family)